MLLLLLPPPHPLQLSLLLMARKRMMRKMKFSFATCPPLTCWKATSTRMTVSIYSHLYRSLLSHKF